MIEVIESYDAAGVHAEIVGGRKSVRIEPDAGRRLPGNYSDWPGHKNHRSPDVWLPDGFLVLYGAGRTRVTDYNRAIEIAIYHARRR